MPKIILFVDSDPSIIDELPTSGKHKAICVPTYQKALGILKKTDNCRVVVAELNLDGENGIAFLKHVRKQYPKVVRIALSSKCDCDNVQNALNKGRVFQFIYKPCPPATLKKYLAKALSRYDRDAQERQAMRKTLLGSVNAMVDIVDLVNPEAMGFAKRIRKRVLKVGKALGVPSLWQLELAVLLSHIGCVALPNELMEKMDRAEPLSPEEKQIFSMHPSIAANLLDNIEQMALVTDIIRQQHALLSDDQPLEARIIKVALELDFQERKGKNPLKVLKKMAGRKNAFDPRVIKAMFALLHQSGAHSVRNIGVEELEEGMVLAEDLVNMDGVKLLLRGQKVSKASLIRLQSFHEALGVVDHISVATNSE